MDANYIYDIFEETRKNNAPDLYIGLAMLQADKPIPEGQTDREIREFIGAHYNALVEAYKAKDREVMAASVTQCEEEDRQREEAREEQQA